jgi:hypothetical protein
VGRIFNGAAAALTSGRTHHELLLIQVGDAPGPSPGRRRGLYHIGSRSATIWTTCAVPSVSWKRPACRSTG